MSRPTIAMLAALASSVVTGACQSSASVPGPVDSPAEDGPEPVGLKPDGMPFPWPQDEIVLASPDTPFLDIQPRGFFWTCTGRPGLLVENDGDWVPAPNPIPTMGGYTLDGTQVPMGGECDVVSCVPVERPFIRVPLVEFVETSRRSFESRPLHGRLRIVFKHYTDAECRDERVFEQVIER